MTSKLSVVEYILYRGMVWTKTKLQPPPHRPGGNYSSKTFIQYTARNIAQGGNVYFFDSGKVSQRECR